MLLSAAIIVRDEAEHLDGCLQSLEGLVDEIVVEREVTLDGSRVGLSTGDISLTVKGLARDVLTFVDALDLAGIGLVHWRLRRRRSSCSVPVSSAG